MQIVHDAEVLIEIGEHQHRQFQPAAIHFQFGFLQFALLLLKLNLRLDYVRMRHLATIFKLLADVEKTPAFSRGALGIAKLSLRYDKMVISLHNGDDQTASGNLGARLGQCFRGTGAAIVRDPLQRNILMNVALADVFVNSVSADKTSGGRAVALGVQKSGVVVHSRKQRGAALHTVFFG